LETFFIHLHLTGTHKNIWFAILAIHSSLRSEQWALAEHFLCGINYELVLVRMKHGSKGWFCSSIRYPLRLERSFLSFHKRIITLNGRRKESILYWIIVFVFVSWTKALRELFHQRTALLKWFLVIEFCFI